MHSIRLRLTVLVFAFSLLASCAAITGETKNDPSTKTATKALTAFSLSAPSLGTNLKNLVRVAVGAVPASTSGTINESAKTISVTFPTGTDVTGLVATFTSTGASVRIGTTVQTSGTTPNNFSNPVVYRVVAEDGSTADYTVTVTVGVVIVTPPSSEKALTAFSLGVPSSNFNVGKGAKVALGATPAAGSGVINEVGKTIAVSFPAGTAVTALVATFTTTGFSVKIGTSVQTSGTTANNFAAPVVYRVTAADGSTADYTVTVTVAAAAVSDTIPPTLPSPSTVYGTPTTTSMSLSWAQATDANALNYQVRYRATPILNASVSRSVAVAVSGWTTATDWAPASSYPDTVSGTPNPMYTVTGLTLGKSYDFAVSVRDTSLNQSDYTVLTASTVGDLVAPTLSTLASTISTTPLGVTTLAWYDASDAVTAAENLQYSVTVGLKSGSNYIFVGGSQVWTAASLLTRDVVNRFVSTLQYNGANLVAGSTYGVTFSVKDAAVNIREAATIDYAVPAADVTAPVPNSTVPQMSVVGSAYYLNWIKATDNVTAQGNLQYRVDRRLGNASVWTSGAWIAGTDLTTGRLSSQYQSLLVSPLTTGTWQFIVYVRDEATNVGSPYTTFNYLKN